MDFNGAGRQTIYGFEELLGFTKALGLEGLRRLDEAIPQLRLGCSRHSGEIDVFNPDPVTDRAP